MHADRILLDLEQAEQLLLVLQTGTGWVAEREPLAVIVRLHEILERKARRIADSPHLSNLEMQQLGERLGAFEREHLQDMRAQIVAFVFPILGECAHAGADSRDEHAQIVGAAGIARGDVIGEAQVWRVALAAEGE